MIPPKLSSKTTTTTCAICTQTQASGDPPLLSFHPLRFKPPIPSVPLSLFTRYSQAAAQSWIFVLNRPSTQNWSLRSFQILIALSMASCTSGFFVWGANVRPNNLQFHINVIHINEQSERVLSISAFRPMLLMSLVTSGLPFRC
jgi:hypothetical protein